MNYKVYQTLQIISLIIAIVNFKDLRQFKLGAFLPLLVIVNITEIVAANYRFWGWTNNYSIYNFYIIASTPFLLQTVYKMLDCRGNKRWLFLFFALCLESFIIIDTFLIQGVNNIATFSYLSIESGMVILSFLAIAKLFFEDDSTILINEHPYFWINASTVIFGISVLFVIGMSGYIKAHKIQLGGHNIYRYVTQAANYLLYGCYIYAFILCRKLTAKQS